MDIKLHAVIKGSKVNGPGNRFVIWMQGCTHKCQFCYNRDLRKPNLGYLTTVEELSYDIYSSELDGVTISGGEPFDQPQALLELLKLLNLEIFKFKYGIICFTGYTIEEIMKDPIKAACVEFIDLIVEGRYQQMKKTVTCLSGSSNQRFIWLNKEGRGKDLITAASVEQEHDIEIHVDDDSPYMTLTGFPDIDTQRLRLAGIYVIEGRKRKLRKSFAKKISEKVK